MGTIQDARNQALWKGDQFTRQRFRQHTRSMAKMGQGSRLSERELAQEKLGRKFTKAEEGAWHNYVIKGGQRPGGYGGGGGAPTMGEAPTLEMPEYDESKVSALTQKRAAPAVRRLRETTQQAMSETYDNPNVKKMTVREALAGYGTGLEGVVAGAGQAAAAEYGDQYAASVNAAMTKFQAALNRQSQEYSVASQDWLMGRQKYWEDEYEDPYDAFDAFYG